MASALGVFWILLTGCTGKQGHDTGDDTTPDDDSGPADDDRDDDGVTSDEDCDDEDASVGAPPTWYLDDDEDGFGDPAQARETCTPRADEVENDEDCDDSDFSIKPTAFEYCGGGDEDCDGLVDEDDPSVDDDMFYGDADDDGYGVSTDTTNGCTPPEGYADAAGDCDDLDAAIHPGVADPCDGVDQDCDGPEAACRVKGNLEGPDILDRYVAAFNGGTAGYKMAGVGDWDADGFDDLLVSDPWADGQRGAVYRMSGPFTGEVSLGTAPGIVVGVDADQSLGQRIVPLSDADGDGADDVAITWVDAIGVFAGPLIGTTTSADASATWNPGATITSIGEVAAGAFGDGDATGLVASVSEDGDSLRVAVMLDASTGGVIADTDVWIEAPTDPAGIGTAVASGDVNGDGVSDVVIGNPAAAEADDYGMARLWEGPFDTTVDEGDADVEFLPGDFSIDHHWSALGAEVQLADADGDGLDDAYLGDTAYGVCTACLNGWIGIFESPLDSDEVAGTDNIAEVIAGTGAGFGSSFAVGDYDADGASDLFVGQTELDSASLVYGRLSGSYSVQTDEDDLDLYYISSTSSRLGMVDLDADGAAELLLGDSSHDLTADGGVLVVWGQTAF